MPYCYTPPVVLTLKCEVNRRLTSSEMDNNFLFLQEVSSIPYGQIAFGRPNGIGLTSSPNLTNNILGGFNNYVNTTYNKNSIIINGACNYIGKYNYNSSIIGGSCNKLANYTPFVGNSVIISGCNNELYKSFHSAIINSNCSYIYRSNNSIILNGNVRPNKINCMYNSTIISGERNSICFKGTPFTDACNNVIIGGCGNVIGALPYEYSCGNIILGGYNNCNNTSKYSTIIGGCSNLINYSGIISIISSYNSCSQYNYHNSIINGYCNYMGGNNYISSMISSCYSCMFSSCGSSIIGGYNLQLNAINNTVLVPSIFTTNPIGGSSSGENIWLLGQDVVNTVSLDTTQYVELGVNGTIYKIAIVN